MGDPAQSQEAEALAKVRNLLPDDGIARAWANVTFTDNDGRLNEVDVLILTRGGLIVAELKGWHGDVSGNQQDWFHAGRVERNPRILANSKAKRLASVLKDLARSANAPHGTVPFVAEAVVLHGRDSRIRLDQFGAESIWALDGFSVQGLGAARNFSALLTQPPRDPIDRRRANAIDALMNAAGLMPRARQRMIGQYALDSGTPLGEGPGWQDFLVTHPRAKTKRRIRLFPYPKGASRDSRAEIDRRAEREFRLTDGIVHPGVIGPAELLAPEEGPALVFVFDPDELSLADYLARHADDLTFEARERIVQQLAELVRFAHGQRLTHRALSPVSTRVKVDSDGTPNLRIRDWDLARRPGAGTTTATEISRGVTDVFAHVEQDAVLYLAPETLRGGTPDSAQSLDVYGVGAVSFLVLTQKPPATNLAALEALVASDALGLDPRSVMAELSDAHANVILEATAFQEVLRTLDVSEFQTSFEQARRSERQEEPPTPAQSDPLDAGVGDIVGDRFEIEKRRGSGSTGVALQVSDYHSGHEHVILKLAKDDAAAARLAIEARVLDRLDHPRIVKRLDGPLAVGTRQGLLMTDAGLETLSDRIRLEGKATIEQLERWAADLFEAAEHLEERGVFHRDIKPSNLAVKPDPGTRKPRLTLFDFSLAEEPLANVRSGSRPYLDPYLGSGGRPQYDSAAERFAIAVTLFELATSYPIWWPSGDAPGSAAEAPVVEASSFDPGVAEGLVGFFRMALAPATADRHASLDAMRKAWIGALVGADAREEEAEANDAKAAAATLDTKLIEAGLSTRALSALSRVKATTVGELLGVHPMEINQIRGRGEQVKREIASRIRDWRERLSQTTQIDAPVVAGRRPVESYLGTISQKPAESSEDRYKRLRKNGTLKGATEDAVRWVRDLGGVGSLDELTTKLLREYGSTLADDTRRQAAVEVVRAIFELDSRSSSPQFVFQTVRDRSRTVVAYAPDDGSGMSFDDAELHLEALLGHAALVDQLLVKDDVVPAPRLRETLLGSDAPALRLPDARVAQLAIGLSATGSVSSMGEAYRASLDPARAVELALRGAATRELAVVTIEQRVRARFPEVQAVPARPALDAAVRIAMPYLDWLDDEGKYKLRDSDLQSVTYTNTSTTWGRSAADPAIAARLTTSIRDKAALVLVASRKQGLAPTATRLAREHGLRVADLADIALDALKATADANGIKWPIVMRADGQPEGSQDRRNLLQLARLAITPAWDELLVSPEPTIFLNTAVLARVGLVDLIAKITDLATPREAARWFLLPRPLSGGTPDLDGVPFPFGADGWLELSLDAFPSEVEPVDTVTKIPALKKIGRT